MSHVLKKNKVVSNILYENNKINTGVFHAALDNINAKIENIQKQLSSIMPPPPQTFPHAIEELQNQINALAAAVAAAPAPAPALPAPQDYSRAIEELQQQINALTTSPAPVPPPPQDYSRAIEEIQTQINSISTSLSQIPPPQPPQPPQPLPPPPQDYSRAIEDLQSQINALTIQSAPAPAPAPVPAPTTEPSPPPAYSIDTNTLELDTSKITYKTYAPESALTEAPTFILDLAEPINRFILKNFYIKTDTLYKFVFYINRNPFEPAVNYINIENIDIATPDQTEPLLLKLRGEVKKPSVNSKVIKQEFFILGAAAQKSVAAFHTLDEY